MFLCLSRCASMCFFALRCYTKITNRRFMKQKKIRPPHPQVLRLAMKTNIFRLAVKSAFNHIVITDKDGTIIYANSAVERITGYPIDDVLGSTPALWGKQMPASFYKKFWQTIKEEKKVFSGELLNKRKNGQCYYANAIVSPILDSSHELVGFIGTEEDITEKKEIDKMKSEFISITAHQLKTPLTSMLWNLEVLADDVTGKAADMVKDLYSSARSLVTMTNMLLNISRLESGRIHINPKRIKLQSIAKEVIKELEPLAHKKHITINTRFADKKLVLIDHLFARHAIFNFLHNAIQYSKHNSTVSISIFETKEDLRCEVRDSGIGIPKKEQPYIFQRFYRASNAQKHRPDGNGIGLSFVKLLVSHFNGSVGFRSTARKGSTFYFTIPLIGMKKRDGDVGLS